MCLRSNYSQNGTQKENKSSWNYELILRERICQKKKKSNKRKKKKRICLFIKSHFKGGLQCFVPHLPWCYCDYKDLWLCQIYYD